MENNNERNKKTAKELIEDVKKQFEIEKNNIDKHESGNNHDRDFKVGRFFTYNGPNYYLDRQALVFNIYIAPTGDSVDFYKKEIIKFFPNLAEIETPYVIDLFAETLIQVLKMDIDLYINKYAISGIDEEYVVAVEYLDDVVAEESVYLVSDWFKAISDDKYFDFEKEFLKLQDEFDKTLFGGPTIYSLVEAGLKREIPVFYLFEENQFQWGYGCKQLRGRSTTFQTDGIKDTEFTMYKDMVGDFLMMCGFPTPVGKNCYDEEEIVDEALKLGFPVVVKPVAGHKGQGVVTGIKSEDEVRKAYKNIIEMSEKEGINFEGALVQQQIYGTDHRLLAVGGKFAAALERVPAFIDGDGNKTIKELIIDENDKEIRLDNARSPLAKIHIDDDLEEFLALQDLSLNSVTKEGERIVLRRVANISAGGVSINVTDNIHPANIKMVEDIAGFLKVKCLGIDVLAADISKPWTDGNFGIIEINSGPGVFMHLAPAFGGSIDVPGIIMKSHFNKSEFSRIPIIAGNNISQELSDKIYKKLKEIKPDIYFSSLTEKGVCFNAEYFFKNKDHNQNVKIILRNPKTEFALFTHNVDDIFDYGMLHKGADIVILNNAGEAEEKALKNQILPGTILIEVKDNEINVIKDDEIIEKNNCENKEEVDEKILNLISQELNDLVSKYN